MKTIITVLIFVVCIFGFYWLDSLAIEAILKSIPESASDWLGIISIILWIVAFFTTGGIALSISAGVAGLFYASTND